MAKQRTSTTEATRRDEQPTQLTGTVEVTHAWRRTATRTQLERLWNAMELSRNGLLNEPGDEHLDAQRSLLNDFAKAVLGDDAPEMEIHT